MSGVKHANRRCSALQTHNVWAWILRRGAAFCSIQRVLHAFIRTLLLPFLQHSENRRAWGKGCRQEHAGAQAAR